MAYFLPDFASLKIVSAVGDGTSVILEWFTPYPTLPTNKVAIAIYYSENESNLFYEGIKAVYYGNETSLKLSDFEPGQLMFFAIRLLEYAPTFDFTVLPNIGTNLCSIPQSLLAQPLSLTSENIVLVNASEFPSSGLVLIGSELIRYISKTGNTLNLTDINDRGFNDSTVRPHYIDGTDDTTTWLFFRQGCSYFLGADNTTWDKVMSVEVRYDYPNFPGNNNGYHQITEDIVNTDLSASDAANAGFPMYDYSSYHRQDPAMLLSGECIASYQGGEMNCQDDSSGAGRTVRGVSIQDRNDQRQEMLLRLTGIHTVLIQKQMTGITCKCMILHQEQPDPQCDVCVGSGIVVGWVQYFDARNSDGRLRVRYDVYDDVVKQDEMGLDSEIDTSAWSLTMPTIKPRDVLVKYNIAGNEDFRYEVTGVTRNNTLLGMQGMQKLKITRVRKTSPIYKLGVFADTSTQPISTTTSFMVALSGKALPTNISNHAHQIRTNEKSNLTWAQNTTQNSGHNHPVAVINGVLTVLPVLGHTHILG
jgi:hypothetical protein